MLIDQILLISIGCVAAYLAAFDTIKARLPFELSMLLACLGISLMLIAPGVTQDGVSDGLYGILFMTGFTLLIQMLNVCKFKGEGVGRGDLALMVPIGLIVGFSGSLWFLLLAFLLFLGDIILRGVLSSVLKENFGKRMPLGPHLCAALIMIVFGRAYFDCEFSHESLVIFGNVIVSI